MSHTHTHTIDVIVDVRMTSCDVIVGIGMTSLPVYGHTEWYTTLVIIPFKVVQYHRCARGIYSLLMSRLTARICTPPRREKYTPPPQINLHPPRNPGKIFEIFFNKFYASVVFL